MNFPSYCCEDAFGGCNLICARLKGGYPQVYDFVEPAVPVLLRHLGPDAISAGGAVVPLPITLEIFPVNVYSNAYTSNQYCETQQQGAGTYLYRLPACLFHLGDLTSFVLGILRRTLRSDSRSWLNTHW